MESKWNPAAPDHKQAGGQAETPARNSYAERQADERAYIAFWKGSPPGDGANYGVDTTFENGKKMYTAWAIAVCAAYGTQAEQSKRWEEKRLALDAADEPHRDNPMPMSPHDLATMHQNIGRIRATMDLQTHAAPSDIQQLARELRGEANALQARWTRAKEQWEEEQRLDALARSRVPDLLRLVRVSTAEQKATLRAMLNET